MTTPKESSPEEAIKQAEATLEGDLDLKKRKSKLPSIARETKKPKLEHDEDTRVTNHSHNHRSHSIDHESSDDIAKQYKKFITAPKYNFNSDELYCVCRKPDIEGELMISCDGCDEWFHFKCMKLNKNRQGLIAKFFCKFCMWKGVGETLWKRKCRVQKCWEPIRPDSKYCSEEHAISYIRKNLLQNEARAGDCSQEELVSIVAYVGDDYEKLVALGTTFPELPEVEEIKKSKDYSGLPETIRERLTQIDAKIESGNGRLRAFELMSSYLGKVKDKVKLINEKVTLDSEEDQKTAKGKKSKAKKFDLCCFDKSLQQGVNFDDERRSLYTRIVASTDLYADLKDEIDSIVAFHRDNCDEIDLNFLYKENMCLQDRRKCIRHNGWFNLINDDCFKRTAELTASLRRLEAEKFQTLRDYCISIYETK